MPMFLRFRCPRIYAGWWVISAPFLAAMLTVGSGQYAFGLFVEPLEDAFGWSRTLIYFSLSFTAVGSVLAPVLGWIMDRRGVRGIMVASMLLIALSYLLRPMMSEVWHWFALSALQYMGYAGASILPAGRLVSIWFPRMRGRVMGITLMGNNFGGFTFPILTTAALGVSWQVFDVRLAPWQGGYLIFGVIGAALAVYTLVVVREFPSDVGGGSSGGGSSEQQLGGWSLPEVLFSKAFYAIMLAVVFGTFTYSAVLTGVFNHLTAEGVSEGTAGFALSAVAICGMCGKFVMGLVAERITARYALMIDLSGQASFLLLLTFFAGVSPLFLWVFVPLFGFFLGAFGALFPLIVLDAFGVRRYGSILGIINSATAVSFFGGPLLAGQSFDLTESYQFAFVVVAGMFYLGALALTQAGKPQRREGAGDGGEVLAAGVGADAIEEGAAERKALPTGVGAIGEGAARNRVLPAGADAGGEGAEDGKALPAGADAVGKGVARGTVLRWVLTQAGKVKRSGSGRGEDGGSV